jgi:purine-nucleoside phosphorylase
MPEPSLDDPAADPFAVAALAADRIREATGVGRHDIALTLGSGWGRATEAMGEVVAVLPASEVPGFAVSGVPGHPGTITSVALPDGGAALVIGARTHFYEGRGVRRVVHSVRTAAAAGARVQVLTNGAGGLDRAWRPGTPVLIRDHINLTAASPLEGPTFVDLTDLYSARLRAIAREVDPTLDEGVYVQFRGPHYETPAEVEMAGRMGGSIVGMSTALEAIAARAEGAEVLGISLVTNSAAGVTGAPLDHEEVLAAGSSSAARMGTLLAELLPRI